MAPRTDFAMALVENDASTSKLAYLFGGIATYFENTQIIEKCSFPMNLSLYEMKESCLALESTANLPAFSANDHLWLLTVVVGILCLLVIVLAICVVKLARDILHYRNDDRSSRVDPEEEVPFIPGEEEKKEEKEDGSGRDSSLTPLGTGTQSGDLGSWQIPGSRTLPDDEVGTLALTLDIVRN